MVIWDEMRIEYRGDNGVGDLDVLLWIVRGKIGGEERKGRDRGYGRGRDVFGMILRLFGFIEIERGRGLGGSFKKMGWNG